jgi:hypothetical protein
MKNVEVKPLSGETFTIKLSAESFAENDKVLFPTMTCRVKKVYKFSWWRKILFRFGVPFKSMELEEIK